ncbi:hypothetical protein KI387_023919, partial [Taxus chinensis]
HLDSPAKFNPSTPSDVRKISTAFYGKKNFIYVHTVGKKFKYVHVVVKKFKYIHTHDKFNPCLKPYYRVAYSISDCPAMPIIRGHVPSPRLPITRNGKHDGKRRQSSEEDVGGTLSFISFNGVPTCADPVLLNGIGKGELRQWVDLSASPLDSTIWKPSGSKYSPLSYLSTVSFLGNLSNVWLHYHTTSFVQTSPYCSLQSFFVESNIPCSIPISSACRGLLFLRTQVLLHHTQSFLPLDLPLVFPLHMILSFSSLLDSSLPQSTFLSMLVSSITFLAWMQIPPTFLPVVTLDHSFALWRSSTLSSLQSEMEKQLLCCTPPTQHANWILHFLFFLCARGTSLSASSVCGWLPLLNQILTLLPLVFSLEFVGPNQREIRREKEIGMKNSVSTCVHLFTRGRKPFGVPDWRTKTLVHCGDSQGLHLFRKIEVHSRFSLRQSRYSISIILLQYLRNAAATLLQYLHSVAIQLYNFALAVPACSGQIQLCSKCLLMDINNKFGLYIALLHDKLYCHQFFVSIQLITINISVVLVAFVILVLKGEKMKRTKIKREKFRREEKWTALLRKQIHIFNYSC